MSQIDEINQMQVNLAWMDSHKAAAHTSSLLHQPEGMVKLSTSKKDKDPSPLKEFWKALTFGYKSLIHHLRDHLRSS